MNKRKIGDRGEQSAISYLENKGYQILTKNYLKRSGEIDIVAYDPVYEEYVFVEVKLRKNNTYGYPEEFVDDQKLEKMESTIDYWLKENNVDSAWRIDIISVIGHNEADFKIKHLQNI